MNKLKPLKWDADKKEWINATKEDVLWYFGIKNDPVSMNKFRFWNNERWVSINELFNDES